MHQENAKFKFRGIDHIALVCSDMAKTYDFYHNKLGMPVLHTIEYFDDKGDVVGQHYYFGVGDDEAHIAMFCWKDGYQTIPREQIPSIPKPLNPRAQPIGTHMHFNLRVDAENIKGYCELLTRQGIGYRHVVRYVDSTVHGGMRQETVWNVYQEPGPGALMSSVYMKDPDNIEVEFNAWLPEWKGFRVPQKTAGEANG